MTLQRLLPLCSFFKNYPSKLRKHHFLLKLVSGHIRFQCALFMVFSSHSILLQMRFAQTAVCYCIKCLRFTMKCIQSLCSKTENICNLKNNISHKTLPFRWKLKFLPSSVTEGFFSGFCWGREPVSKGCKINCFVMNSRASGIVIFWVKFD